MSILCFSNVTFLLWTLDTNQDLGTIAPKYQAAHEGSIVSMSCLSYTEPQWSKKDDHINASASYSAKLGTSVIVISNVKVEHSGKYKCTGNDWNMEQFVAHSILMVGGETACWLHGKE